MLRFLSDEDFNRAIVRGVLRLRADVDIVRVQDVDLGTLNDSIVLEWAAVENRVVLTHDTATMPTHAYRRVANALALPGVFVAQQEEAISRIIEDIILLADCSLEHEWDGQVNYLPLK